ncbi:hypothetical protein LINGRAHAP2_LOCUS37568 [Linum grandiflorum]
MVKPPKDVVAEGCVLWGNTLVGQFVGQRLHYQAVHSIAHKIWGNMGLEEFLLRVAFSSSSLVVRMT